MDFTPLFPKIKDLNRPHSEPRVLNLIAISYPEALTSNFCLLKRVSNFYRPAESEKTDIFTKF